MTRTAALRASILFLALAVVFGVVGAASQVVAAEALFMISASLCAMMLLFSFVPPPAAAARVRVRRVPTRR